MPNLTTAAPSAQAPAEKPGNRTRVLHLIAGDLYGGVETLLLTLAQLRHLCPSMDPHFAVCYEGRLSQELRAAGVPVFVLGNARISRPWTVWRARRRLRVIVDRERFDAVICHMAWTMAMFGGTARSAGARVVFWAHGWQTGRGWLERMARRVTPDLVISNSRFTASSISTLWPVIESRVLYCPVALTPFLEAARWRADLRREYGVADDTTVIIQISRLEAWKGHRLHLHALSRLKELEGWVCWFVGGPQKPEEETYLEDLRKTAIELGIEGRIRFLGQRPDVRNLLAAADLFCQPNEAPEPFGIVFIEAMWAELPVVSTTLGGALEIIDDSCGLLAKPNDASSLAECLGSLIQSRELRRRLGRAGVSRARQLCNPAQQMQSLEGLVRQPSNGNATAS